MARCHGIRPKYQAFQSRRSIPGLRSSISRNVVTSPTSTPVDSCSTSRTNREQNWRRDRRLKPVSYSRPMRRLAACCRRGISSSESGRGNRSTATRPSAERRTKLENLVRHESGTRLSAIRARPRAKPTTMPTWLVHVPVASAIWRNGAHGMRVKTISPARNVTSSSRRFKMGSFGSRPAELLVASIVFIGGVTWRYADELQPLRLGLFPTPEPMGSRGIALRVSSADTYRSTLRSGRERSWRSGVRCRLSTQSAKPFRAKGREFCHAKLLYSADTGVVPQNIAV